MPIKDLQNATRHALQSLGKLRKGGEKGPNGFGADLTYFRFVTDDPDVAAAWGRALPGEVDTLRVFMAYSEPGETFESWKEEWGKGVLKHRCNGEFCVKWRNADGSYTVDQRMEQRHPCPGGCREVGRLAVIVPELLLAGFSGLVTLETHSVNDIVHIQRVLDDTNRRAGGAGLDGIEFVLSRQQERISTPDGRGGRRMVDRWMIHLTPAAEWLYAQLRAAQMLALGTMQFVGVDPCTGEAVPAKPRWQNDPAQVEAFKRHCEDLGLGAKEVLARLGVARVGEAPWAYEQCVAVLEGRITLDQLKGAA